MLKWFRIVKRRVRRKPRTQSKRNKIALALHKEGAKELALSRLEHFNQFYNFKYNSVKIKSTKTRWGSCSSKGNLNFSYKIALLPSHLVDYLIVHELCHLGEFNHSEDFWALVAQTIPDFYEKRIELKKVHLN
ncbi:MAG: M48 family metallopeptidase [bacterium]